MTNQELLKFISRQRTANLRFERQKMTDAVLWAEAEEKIKKLVGKKRDTK